LFDMRLGNKMVHAVLDAAWAYKDGKYAAFYVLGLFGGARVTEIARIAPSDFHLDDGILSIPASASKTRARTSEVTKNLIVMVQALIAKGMFEEENLKPSATQRMIIQILAGFSHNFPRITAFANRARMKILRKGLPLTSERWNMPWPRNGLRRTALSMHFQLFGDVQRTTRWGGNSPGIFKKYYERLCSKAGAAEYWVMLPAVLAREGIAVGLPEGHKLDPVIDKELKEATAKVTAVVQRQIIQANADEEAEAKAKARAYWLKVREKKNAQYRARYWEKKQARMAQTRQNVIHVDSSSGNSTPAAGNREVIQGPQTTG
jgi:hypothetical protein